ncbi:efflux RND transporter permease subunit [Desulfosporosinus youngiae]|uniref:Cation/multidrug efflux pump n=1 Tax=Desulfosporosinus youngiae DSM 17734 TaxID=768710 RepID=H5XV12_9FIRM|nr:efflux RND transporter permease subunit [Desulfosporosinus youngiae]EHQ89464.1 cation/multidrug efflux pump [Desulfosporosinus youngiae DSM 17734]
MIEYLIKKRKITLLFFVMLVVYGLTTFFQLAHQEQPDIVVDTAMVLTVYPGASPEKVEQTVTKKIEEKINEIQGLKSITSQSNPQYSKIVVELQEGVDPKEKWNELRNKVKDVESSLPSDCKQPEINDDLSKTFIETFAVTAGSYPDVYDLRDTLKIWKDQLRTLPNVADVSIMGLPDQEIRIDVDTHKINQLEIPWTQVAGAVKKEIERTPLGDIEQEDRLYQLKVKDNHDPEALYDTVVAMNKEGIPVYLRDVATITLAHEKEESLVSFNGKPAISISVQGEIGSDVPSMRKNVDEMMKRLEKQLPPGALLNHVYSQNERIDDLFSDLTIEVLLAVAAVLLVCSLGLNLVTSFIIALAIPISLSMGLMLTPNLNITLNLVSIAALIIVLGILVDDAVVVNDNIERRLVELGEPPLLAVVKGTNEVFISILTATTATIFAFGPIAFLQGNVGQFIRPLPIIISLSMISSMAMSLTIVPIFRHWRAEKLTEFPSRLTQSNGFLGNQLDRLAVWYADKLMPQILKKPMKVGLIAVLISTLAYGLFPLLPVQLFPNSVRGEMLIDVRMPKGESLKGTNQKVQEIADWVQKQEGIILVNTYAGDSAPSMFRGDLSIGKGNNIAQIVVRIDTEEKCTEELVQEWNAKFNEMYPGIRILAKEIKFGPPIGAPIDIRIYGEDLQVLQTLEDEVKDCLLKYPGAVNINGSIGQDTTGIELTINKAQMNQNLVKYDDLTKTLRLATEGIEVSEFDNGQDLISIMMYSDKSKAEPMLVFDRLYVPNANGKLIPLKEIAQMETSFSLNTVPRRNLSRLAEVTCDLDGVTATAAMEKIKPLMEGIELPEGYTLEFGGETSEQTDIFTDMGRLMIVAIFLILIVIAMQFYSLSLPILVMSTVYLAFAGSMIGLLITRTPFGFGSVMGLICLVGIVVRNGIVLIEFIENERHAGVTLEQAVINAGRARLKPVLLTAGTAIAGLLSLATGKELMFRALAITIIAGLFYSTIMTLVIVPSFYTVLAKWKEKRNINQNQKMLERV